MTDPYLDAHGVLKNRFGLRDPETLARAEADYTKSRLFELRRGDGPEGRFDGDHLRALHRHIFGDVYAWAGKTRGDISESPPLLIKGETVFTVSAQVHVQLDQTLEPITDVGLAGTTRAEFAERAADLLADLNTIHPFREGNGRTQRAFLSELARDAGHRLDWDVVSQERMISISIDGSRGERDAVRRLMTEITDPARVEALRGAIRYLESEGVNWNERYLATATPGVEYQGIVAASGSRHTILFSSDQQVIVAQTRDLPRERDAETVQFRAGANLEQRHDLDY